MGTPTGYQSIKRTVNISSEILSDLKANWLYLTKQEEVKQSNPTALVVALVVALLVTIGVVLFSIHTI